MKLEELKAMRAELKEKFQQANKDQWQARQNLDALTSATGPQTWTLIDRLEIEMLRKAAGEKERQAFKNACQQREALPLKIKTLEALKLDIEQELQPIEQQMVSLNGKRNRSASGHLLEAKKKRLKVRPSNGSSL